MNSQEARLKRIEALTNNYIFCGTPIRITLLAYCEERNLIDGYDGLFWGNEGYYWEYNFNKEVVKEIDDLFIDNLKKYPRYANMDYQTRYEYLKENDIFE